MPKNPRGKLMIVDALVERLDWECQFLHLDNRLFLPDPEGPQSRADIIRRAVDLFLLACDSGLTYSVELQPETQPVSFYYKQGDLGLWDYGVSQHYAVSHHQLANFALHWYFARIDAQEESDRATYERLKALSIQDVEFLLRSGGLQDALSQAPTYAV